MPAKRPPEELSGQKAKAPKVNHNEALCKVLMEMGQIEKNQGQPFKFKAYRVAADSLRTLDRPIKSGAEAAKLPGVGAKIAKKIDEILETGKLHQLEQYHEDPLVSARNTFNKITGIGPVMAQKLIDKGYRTIEDLRNAPADLFTKHQHIGIRYFEDLQEKIPYNEVEEHAELVRKAMRKVDKRLELTVCGSHRRMKATSGDIDCLLTHPVSSSDSGANYIYLNKVYERLVKDGYFIDTISEGKTKVMAVCKLPGQEGAKARRIDLRWVPYDCYYPAILYFTGSDMFNTVMRAEANKAGYTMNEYGVYEFDDKTKTKGKKIPVDSEEAIFKLIGKPFVPASERDM